MLNKVYAGELERQIAEDLARAIPLMDAHERRIMQEALAQYATDSIKKRVYRGWYDFVYDWPVTSSLENRFAYLAAGFKKLLPQATSACFFYNERDYYAMRGIHTPEAQARFLAETKPQLARALFSDAKDSLKTLIAFCEEDFKKRVAVDDGERGKRPTDKSVKKIEYLQDETILYFPLGWQGSSLFGGLYFSLKKPIPTKEMQCLQDPVYRKYGNTYNGDLIDAISWHFWDTLIPQIYD